jgi:hypothetical protein
MFESKSGWEVAGTGGGISLDADSVSFQANEDVRQFNDRMTAERHPHENTFQEGVARPGGDLTFSPTLSELPPILLNLFQAVGAATSCVAGSTFKMTAGTAYGTLLFAMVRAQPDTAGSTWGTIKSVDPDALTLGPNGTIVSGDIYPLTFDVYPGDTVGTGERYMDCIADNAVFNAAIGANLSVSYSMMSGSYQRQFTTKPVANFVTQGEDEFADWRGTLQIGGVSYDIESFKLTVPNALTDRMRLGKRFPSKLRLGSELPSGAFDYELADANLFNTYASAIIDMNWYIDSNTWLRVHMPNCKFGEYAKEISGGNTPLVNSIPFTAYPSGANSGTPPIMVALHGTFATRGFTCYGSVNI